VAAAVVTSYLLVDILYVTRLAGAIGAGAHDFLRSLAAPTFASLGMVVILGELKRAFEVGVWELSLLVVVGAGVYLALLLAFDRVFMASQFRHLIADLLNALRVPLRAAFARAAE
jgi:hypothetical protein